MASVTDKISLLFRTKLHGILDRAIGNDPNAVKTYIRDLEDAIRETNAAAAAAKADLILANREIVGLQKQVRDTSDQADMLLSDSDPSNDHWVTDTLEPKQMKLENELKVKQEALAGLQTAADSLADVARKMTAKCEQMKGQLSTLEAKARAAAAKTKAADAIEAVGDIANTDVSASVDSIAAKINRDDEVATQRLAQATGTFAGGDGAAKAVADSEAAARTAARRARLAAKGQTGGAPTT